MIEQLMQRVATAVVEDPENGQFRCRRDVFTDPDLFELEMKHIFGQNWVYLAHESQFANKNDYFTAWIGRTSVILSRSKDGEINCVVNACAHRGAKLCRRKRGNQPLFVCPFHGWSFKTDGTLLRAKDASTGAYPDSFNHEGSHDLTRVRVESYRGFVFGSLNPDVKPLVDHLGETKVIIDQIVDQAPDGLEVLTGNSSYTFNGNWKMQMENGCDGYHVSYGFEHGHMLLWTQVLNPEVRPIWNQKADLEARLGVEKAGFILNQTRNLALYPNVFLMDQFSTQIRVVRPIDVETTEITIYCFAPKGESAEDRAHRIRQYEDFFNVSGMGTPDDLEEFASCQSAFKGGGELWNDLSRGATRWIAGPDDNAKAMGMNPLLSSTRSEDEGLFVRQHEYWAQTMLAALANEPGDAAQLEAAE